jgi:hypothetical protein
MAIGSGSFFDAFRAKSGASPLAICLVYPWGRSLDGKDDQRDNETPEDNPGARPSNRTKLIAKERKFSLSMLDQLLLDSEDYAKELGERLKDRVFEDVFPYLAEGFIEHIRRRDGVRAELSQETLDVVYQGTLTLLYRLLFLLYAECRDLLPAREVRGYYDASLARLKRDVAAVAGDIEDEVEERIKRHLREDRFELYDRLSHLCVVVDQGNSSLNVPVYNGGLFLSVPEDYDQTLEARAARFLNGTRCPTDSWPALSTFWRATPIRSVRIWYSSTISRLACASSGLSTKACWNFGCG